MKIIDGSSQPQTSGLEISNLAGITATNCHVWLERYNTRLEANNSDSMSPWAAMGFNKDQLIQLIGSEKDGGIPNLLKDLVNERYSEIKALIKGDSKYDNTKALNLLSQAKIQVLEQIESGRVQLLAGLVYSNTSDENISANPPLPNTTSGEIISVSTRRVPSAANLSTKAIRTVNSNPTLSDQRENTLTTMASGIRSLVGEFYKNCTPKNITKTLGISFVACWIPEITNFLSYASYSISSGMGVKHPAKNWITKFDLALWDNFYNNIGFSGRCAVGVGIGLGIVVGIPLARRAISKIRSLGSWHSLVDKYGEVPGKFLARASIGIGALTLLTPKLLAIVSELSGSAVLKDISNFYSQYIGFSGTAVVALGVTWRALQYSKELSLLGLGRLRAKIDNVIKETADPLRQKDLVLDLFRDFSQRYKFSGGSKTGPHRQENRFEKICENFDRQYPDLVSIETKMKAMGHPNSVIELRKTRLTKIADAKRVERETEFRNLAIDQYDPNYPHLGLRDHYSWNPFRVATWNGTVYVRNIAINYKSDREGVYEYSLDSSKDRAQKALDNSNQLKELLGSVERQTENIVYETQPFYKFYDCLRFACKTAATLGAVGFLAMYRDEGFFLIGRIADMLGNL